MSLTLEVFPPDRWANEVADRFESQLARSAAPRLSLATGNTPQPLYAELVRRQVDLAAATCFLLDEFLDIPVDHPARCETMLRLNLLNQLEHPPQLRTMDAAAPDLSAEATRYDAEVADGSLDLVVLGLGMNGHLALNEPGSSVDSPTRVVTLEAGTRSSAATYGHGGAPPTRGFTLGLRTLLAAREVMLLVTGREKAAILARVRHGAVGEEIPASFLREHPSATILADTAAMSVP